MANTLEQRLARLQKDTGYSLDSRLEKLQRDTQAAETSPVPVSQTATQQAGRGVIGHSGSEKPQAVTGAKSARELRQRAAKAENPLARLVGESVTAGVQGSAAGLTGALSTLVKGADMTRRGVTDKELTDRRAAISGSQGKARSALRRGDVETARRYTEDAGKLRAALAPLEDEKEAEALREGTGTLSRAANRLDAVYDDLRARAAAHSERAVTDQRDAVGRVASELITQGTQMLGDAAANAIAPGAGLAVMGARSFGDASQQARQSGASVGEQIGYGISNAGVEVLTEKMFDGLAGIYGKGGADEVVEKVIDKLAKNDRGRAALKVLASMGGEALEEVVSGVVDPALESIYQHNDVRDNYSRETAADIAYSALIGGLLGGLGGAAEIIGGANKNASPQVWGQGAARTDNAGNLTPAANGGVEAQISPQSAQTQKAAPEGTARLHGNIPMGDKAVVFDEYQRRERHSDMLDALRAGMPMLQGNAVAQLSGYEFQKTSTDGRTMTQKISDFFASLGNKVNNKSLGEIELNEAGAHDTVGHGVGKVKAAAFAALPNVLSDGKIFKVKGPYEGHNYDSVYIGAPVRIGSETCYVGALVIKDEKMQRYKLHEVLVTNGDGTPLFQSESASIPENTDGPLRSDVPSGNPNDSLSSEFTIPQPSNAVKSDMEPEARLLPTGLDERAGTTPEAVEKARLFPTGQDLTPAESLESKTTERGSYRADFPAEQHIDNRDMESVKPRSVNAFQFDHPELHQYFVGAAQALIADADASLSQPNSRQRVYGQQGRKFNQSAQTSPQLRSAMDDAKLSRSQIIDAAERIVNNHGQENVAAAKKLELILDDMLSNGYTTMYGENIAPNADYLAAKKGIAGARIGPEAGSFEQYVAENRLALEMGEVTMDGLRAEWEAEQQKTAPEGTAKRVPNALNPLELEPRPLPTGLDDGLGAADANSVNTDYDRLQAQSDKFHPSGPSPVRHTDVPTTNFDGRNIPKSTSTIYGAQGTPDAAVMKLEQMIADGTLAFDTITDKDAIASARTTMERKGFEGALEQYRNTVASNAVSKNNTALGQQLLLRAMREGNTAATAELLTLYTRNSTNTAQALQAESIFRKLSPEGQLTAVQRAIDSFNEKHDTDVQMSEEDISDFVNAESEAEREAVRQRILENVASAVPGTFKAKYDAIRYLAMLGNPRTHIRNILGNTLFQAPVTVKNRVGAVEEIIANAVSGGKVERTKSLTGVNPFGSLAKEARADFDNVKELLGQTHKYIDGQTSLYDIEENIKAFSDGNFLGRGMNALAEGNSYLLEAEDTMAKKFIYTQSLAGYLKANGVKTMQGLADTLEGRQLLDRARNYAAQEAMRNTFNDKNAASDAVAKLGGLYRSENPVERGFGYVVEGVLPFKRTPTNILMRALEYSPAGAAAGIVQTIQGAKAGDSARVTQGLDRMAAGMTGTGLMYLGAVLAGAGLIRGGDDDDEKQAKFDDLRGHQNYSVELSDGTSVTLDWLAPEAIPFFMGVELYNAALDGGVTFEDFQQTFRDATAPMLEMSMLQGLNNTFDNAAYAKNSGGSVAGAVLTSALTNYLTQMFPTLFGQAERSFGESERMATYTDKNSSVPSDLQYTLGKVSQKIPGWDYNQIPYIDAWGRTESTGVTGQRAANNFLNPAFISQISDDAVEDELQRLYSATGEAGVLPQRAARYFTADGERKDLTGEEYVAYATAKGQLSRELITEFLNSDGYAQMDDASKAKAVSDLYSYANAKAKESVFGIGLNSTAAKIQAAVDSGISPAQYFTFNAKLDALTPLEGAKGVSDMQRFRVIAGEDMGDDEKLAAIGAIMGTDMATESGGKSQYAKMLDVLDTGATLDQYLDLSDAGAIDNYLKYQSAQGDRDYGIEPEAFAQFQTGKSQYDADGNNSYTQKEVAAAIEGIFGDTLTTEQKAVIWQLYNKSWKPKGNPYNASVGRRIYDELQNAPQEAVEEPRYLPAP